MEFPKEAAAMEIPHMSPPRMTTGRLPKRFTSTLLIGPAVEKEGKQRERKYSGIYIYISFDQFELPFQTVGG